MTKSSYEKMSMESLHGVDYSTGNIKQDEYPASSETPVLDLSCKKSMTSSPAPEYKKDPSVSPHQSSHYHEAQETNNNDNKHINSYQMHHHHKMENQEIEHSPQNQTHHYPREESPAYSSSTNHERKSPFENRVYIMTPPSESDSPKKSRFRSIYDSSNIEMNETQTHPAYPPMLPMNIPVPLPISVPAVHPTLLSQNNSPVSPMQIPTSSTTHEISQSTQIVAADDSKKLPRPFKAYPKDPLSITLGPDMMFDQDLKKAYSDFRNRMLDSVKRTNEGTNIKMRRVSKSPILTPNPSDEKDAAYWERRRKNNEAAKRSRDARRAKEDEIAIRAAFLEQEYIRLKYENAVLKDENAKIKCLLYGH